MQGLYLITPDDNDTTRLLARVAAVLPGAALLQYRNKTADAALRHEQTAALLQICRRAGVPLLVNDDWRLAAAVGADGAHLGGSDGAIGEARAALGESAILGASCYGRITLARAAAAAGASYVAFGAFFPSATKPDAPRADPALLAAAAPLGLPRAAIGGITPDNAQLLVDAGADLIAVIGAVFDAADPAAAAQRLRACFHPASDADGHTPASPRFQTRTP